MKSIIDTITFFLPNQSSSGDETEWIEKSTKQIDNKISDVAKSDEKTTNLQRDEWMDLKGLFPCVSNDEIKGNKKQEKKEKEAANAILMEPGQSGRELNPYWKNGGTGLPENESEKKSGKSFDINWLKKSLRRAEQQAEEEDRTLEEVAAERWGVSVFNFFSMLIYLLFGKILFIIII